MSAGNWKDMFKGVQTGDLNLVEYYLNIGTDPNYQHPEFNALVLVESIRFNHLEITQLLLDKGAKVELKENWGGETAWSVAKTKNNLKVLALLEKYK